MNAKRNNTLRGLMNRIRECADHGAVHGACCLSQSDCRKLLASTRPADPEFYGPGLAALLKQPDSARHEPKPEMRVIEEFFALPEGTEKERMRQALRAALFEIFVEVSDGKCAKQTT